MGSVFYKSMILGPVGTNCYLVINRANGQALVIDPADEADRILQQLTKLEARPAAILLTHGHFDHIGAVGVLADTCRIPVYIGEKDAELAENAGENASLLFGLPAVTAAADHLLKDGEILQLAGIEIRVIETPGHTQGGVCYYLPQEKILFSGDTLFQGSVGRTDLPTGSMQQLIRSLHEKLYLLDDEVEVFPGHGSSTTIRDEKRYNPY